MKCGRGRGNIGNHNVGRILIRSSLTFEPLDFVTVHGKVVLLLLGRDRNIIIPVAH